MQLPGELRQCWVWLLGFDASSVYDTEVEGLGFPGWQQKQTWKWTAIRPQTSVWPRVMTASSAQMARKAACQEGSPCSNTT